jgi:hypothetical protein
MQRAVMEGAARFDAASFDDVPAADAVLREASMPIRMDADAERDVDPMYRAGVYQMNDRVVARNVSQAELDRFVIDAEDVAGLMSDVRFRQFEENATAIGEGEQRELWTWFLLAMLGFLFVEAILCFPKSSQVTEGASSSVIS